MKFINNWYPVILAFLCLIYSVTYGILGMYEEAQYSAHWLEQYYYLQLQLDNEEKKYNEYRILHSGWCYFCNIYGINYMEHHLL
ncbi:hypothetical protein [Polaribacter sp. HL-MS24]|uniref:hypothetical protein n=1 Tax=Polaribacter sp. HL-MS24 TaxID=3077735 RepID=UPI002934556F|nr:hypothetical protein [Polaribacter sp. HL-MS24]WOC40937.1 hypothetical protein RRF69_03985 [Polaribacter sp. HL-MS24]